MKKELCDLLTIEKGNAAKIFIQSLSTEEPGDFRYDKSMIEELFKDLETDYYGRFKFNHLQ